MNELQVFNNIDFGEVRTALIDNKPMFCLVDVCRVLELTTPSKVRERLNEKGVSNIPTPTNGGTQTMIFIDESNLYKVIFQSRKPQAKQFTDWVTSEVLPTIREHGAYMTEQTLEKALYDPDFLIKLATELKKSKEQNKQLEIANTNLTIEKQTLQPKADYFDELVDRNLLTNFRETANQLHIRQKDFIEFLLEKKYVYRDKKGKLLPYADKNNGLFEIKETFNEMNSWSGTQTLITPKGRETFRLLIKKGERT